MSISTRINPIVYAKGIETTITDSTKRLAVVLLDDAENIIATSALISNDSSASSADGGASDANATYLTNSFSFSDINKQLTVPTIAYTATKSLVSASANAPVAKGFAVVAFNNLDEAAEEAFEGAGKYFKFPSGVTTLGENYASDEAVPLIVGTLSSEPIINANSNFRLTSTTITFAESSVA
jgi:hypothetical protein